MLVLFAAVELDYPVRLGCLAFLLLLAYFAWRSRSMASPARRWASLACRSAAVALLVVAFAGIAVRGTSDQRRVILLVDCSRSVRGEGQMAADRFVQAVKSARSRHDVVVWEFADRPRPAAPDPSGSSPSLDDLDSVPAAALQMAAAAIPDHYVPQIVLLTDGIETRGQAASAALGTGIPVDVVPLRSFSEPDACLLDLRTGPLDPVAGTVLLEAIAYSNHRGRAQLQIAVDGQKVSEHPVDLVEGEQTIPLSVLAGLSGPQRVRATLLAASDSIPENNVRHIRLPTPETARILLIDAQPQRGGAFRTALAGVRFTVDADTPDRLADRLSDVADYDLVVLAGLSPRAMGDSVHTDLEQYVRDGGGLIVIGGEETYGHSVYSGSRLESLLPVTAAEAIETRRPVLAIMLVIDRSETMEEENRMELAKLAAKQCVELLEPHDKAGVMAYSDGPMWIAEIETVANRESLLAKIDTLFPAGQTYMYQAVERAFLALNQTTADRRYMILLTDGVPAPGDYLEISKRMAQQGITLSTVSLGPEAEQDLLIEMARIAGGRHHHCDDPKDVPGVMVRETRAAAAEDTPQSFVTSVYRELPGLEIDGAPPLAGYVLTNPKPEAEQLLMAAGRDPLLAWWPYGSGIAVALTCDTREPVNPRWQDWPGYQGFWQRLVRHATRRPATPTSSLRVERQGDTALVQLDIEGDTPVISLPTIHATLTLPEGVSNDLPLRRVVRGRYQASFQAADLGEYRIEATIDGITGSPQTIGASLFIDYPDELRLQQENRPLLQAIAETTGGRFDPSPESVLASDGRTVPQRYAPWRILVLGSLLLVIVDLAIRRLRFS